MILSAAWYSSSLADAFDGSSSIPKASSIQTRMFKKCLCGQYKIRGNYFSTPP